MAFLFQALTILGGAALGGNTTYHCNTTGCQKITEWGLSNSRLDSLSSIFEANGLVLELTAQFVYLLLYGQLRLSLLQMKR